MIPLVLGVAGATIVTNSDASNPPSDELREQADDCIEKIREKQRKIQKEIDLLKTHLESIEHTLRQMILQVVKVRYMNYSVCLKNGFNNQHRILIDHLKVQ